MNDEVIGKRMAGFSTVDILRSPVVKGMSDIDKGG